MHFKAARRLRQMPHVQFSLGNFWRSFTASGNCSQTMFVPRSESLQLIERNFAELSCRISTNWMDWKHRNDVRRRKYWLKHCYGKGVDWATAWWAPEIRKTNEYVSPDRRARFEIKKNKCQWHWLSLFRLHGAVCSLVLFMHWESSSTLYRASSDIQ